VAAKKKEPYKSEKISGSDLSRITLEEKAAKRIELKTETVKDLVRFGGETNRRAVPHGAVIYDAKGGSWVYTNPEGLLFVRQAITIDYVEGDIAVIRDGPPAGMKVVTEGATQLTGIEFGVGK
jgi:multidrug efflux pump subunit AcrA (membrane-fusion protein)